VSVNNVSVGTPQQRYPPAVQPVVPPRPVLQPQYAQQPDEDTPLWVGLLAGLIGGSIGGVLVALLALLVS
jgi:hypothetical protein